MKIILSLLLFAMPAFFETDQTSVPVAKEPSHHLKLENSCVRVYDVVVPPGKETLMHVHAEDYFFVNFGEATLKNQADGQPEQDLNLKDGEVRYTPATLTHRIRNVGKTPFHNLTVELLQPPAPSPKPLPLLGKNQAIVLENDRIRAIQTMLQPGETTGLHSHPRQTLTIMVDKGSIRIESPGEGPQKYRYAVKPGEFIWNDAPLAHSLKNLGKTPVRVVEVEVK